MNTAPSESLRYIADNALILAEWVKQNATSAMQEGPTIELTGAMVALIVNIAKRQAAPMPNGIWTKDEEIFFRRTGVAPPPEITRIRRFKPGA